MHAVAKAAEKPSILNVGRCAMIDGDARPYRVVDVDGAGYKLVALIGYGTKSRPLFPARRAPAEVHPIAAKGSMCALCRYEGTWHCRVERKL